ncbi:MAG: hypothetical protein KAT05_01910 [Spirochaetes bacterium]|nr:hypothetical protein [Spirochaetota bacterium]
MKRCISIILFLFLFIFTITGIEAKTKIAILDFGFNETKIDNETANDIIQLFITAFINTLNYEVIERNKLNLINGRIRTTEF